MLRPEATALFILLAFFDTRNVVGHPEVTMRAMREALGAVVKAFSAARAVMHPVHRSNRSGGSIPSLLFLARPGIQYSERRL